MKTLSALILFCASLVAQPTVNMLQKGIDNSGATDVSSAVQKLVNALGPYPAALYFPAGTYYFRGTRGSEECVRIATSGMQVYGDGAGRTIFKTDTSSGCMATLGFFALPQDYSYEDDIGYGVRASSAFAGATNLALSSAGNTSRYPGGSYVYLRGSSIDVTGEFHGELNQVVSAGSGVVSLAWPLSSDFSKDGGLQLNVVASSEVLQNIEVWGITFNFASQAMMGAQTLGLDIHDNVFNYTGTSTLGAFQFNQNRMVTFHDNTINTYNSSGVALDPSRDPTGWQIYNNTIYGSIGIGESGANTTIQNNVIHCQNVPACIGLWGTYGNLIQGNQVYGSLPNGGPAVIWEYAWPYANNPNTTITGNTIVSSTRAPAVIAATSGTTISGNTITAGGTGVDIQSGGVTLAGNSVTLTSNGTYGCVLVEGQSHADSISGLNCAGGPGVTGWAGIYVSDQGPQFGNRLTVSSSTFSNLTRGVAVSNTANDLLIKTGLTFLNVAIP
jgi:hypothetical protein